MASEDVLERVEAMRQADQFRWTTYRRDLVEMIEALAAEVRELRKDKARLDWLSGRSETGLREAIDIAMEKERT